MQKMFVVLPPNKPSPSTNEIKSAEEKNWYLKNVKKKIWRKFLPNTSFKKQKKIVLKNKRNDSNTWTKYHFVDMHSYTKRNIVTHAFNLMRIQNIVDWY